MVQKKKLSHDFDRWNRLKYWSELQKTVIMTINWCSMNVHAFYNIFSTYQKKWIKNKLMDSKENVIKIINLVVLNIIIII